MTQINKPDVKAVKAQANAQLAAAEAASREHVAEARAHYNEVHQQLDADEQQQISTIRTGYEQNVAAADQVVTDAQDAVAKAVEALKAAQAALVAAKADFKTARHDRAVTVKSLTSEFTAAVGEVHKQALAADAVAQSELKSVVKAENGAVAAVRAEAKAQVSAERSAATAYTVWKVEDTVVRAVHGVQNVVRTLGDAFNKGYQEEGLTPPKKLEDRVVRPTESAPQGPSV